MTTWLPATGLDNSIDAPGLIETLQLTFMGANPDALSGATPLDTFKTYAGQPEILDSNPILHGSFAGFG